LDRRRQSRFQSAIGSLQSEINNLPFRVAARRSAVEDTANGSETHVAAVHDRQLQVQVLSTSMMIHDLSIERPAVVDYLRTIDPDKQAIALIHAIEVGVTEMLALRGRSKR
jgi:hypothetical protein